MECPKCRCRVFLRFGTLQECVYCGYKLEELEGWLKENKARFI